MWAFLAVLLLLPNLAFARDPDGSHANSPLHKWFDQLKSEKGLCCSFADGQTVEDPDWESVNDASKPTVHYRVFIENEWVDVPDEAVITEPNLFGRTMVWPYVADSWTGTPHKAIRCFMAGPLS